MNRTAIVLLVVLMLFTISLASFWEPAVVDHEEGTRADFSGLIVDENIGVNTNWSVKSPSFPYDFISIQANISVLPGITLTIEPGVIVKFNYRTSLSVSGTLMADGTYFSPISFTPAASDPGTLDWKGVAFQNESTGSVMNYVNVEYADGGIAIYGCDPLISNCSLQYNHYYGFLCDENSQPIIKNNYVNFTRWAGIICGNNSIPTVENNFITTCYYGIICYDYAVIDNNAVESSFIGIMCWGDADVTNNKIRNCRDGIQSFYSSPRIENNNIVRCTGNGTRFMGSNSIIKNNILWNNEVGMDINYDAKDILKNMEGNLVNGIDINTCFYVGQDDIVRDNLNIDSG